MVLIESKQLSSEEIYKYLEDNSDIFIPPLTNRVNLTEYSNKIYLYAWQVWAIDSNNDKLAGFMACYFNDKVNNIGYITTISVKKEYQGKKVGYNLLNTAINYAREKDFKKIKLEVNKKNVNAMKFYYRNGFNIIQENETSFLMEVNIL